MNDRKWFVMQTKPRNEALVNKQILYKQIKSYLPQVEKIRIWSDRKKKVLEPLFPGYVFVYANEDERQTAISGTAGAVRYIYYEGRPAVVSPREIKLIEDSLREPEKVSIEQKRIEKGDEIMVTHGIFKGMKGRVQEFRGNFKLTVNLEELSYSFSIILSLGEVEKLKEIA